MGAHRVKFTMEKQSSSDPPNLFPGKWDINTELLLKTYELWIPQNWSPVDLPWDDVNASN